MREHTQDTPVHPATSTEAPPETHTPGESPGEEKTKELQEKGGSLDIAELRKRKVEALKKKFRLMTKEQQTKFLAIAHDRLKAKLAKRTV